MKKTVLAAAVLLSLCVPTYATEQYNPNKDEDTKKSYPVFGTESQGLANMGNHKQEKKFVHTADKNQDDDVDFTTGRMRGTGVQRNLSLDDPNYVPPAAPKLSKKARKNQVDPSTLPVYLNGDHVELENATGDFLATGHVKMRQGAEFVLTNYAFGNMKSGDVYLLEGGTLLEPGSRMEGKWLHYNYNTKTGEMKQIKGRGEVDFYKAPHALIMPDKVVADHGAVTTRCTAQKHVPCMHVEAKRVEFYPKEKLVAHDVKVFIKGKHIYSRKLWMNEFGKKSEFLKPSVGWDGSDNGWYLKLEDGFPLSEKDTLNIKLVQYSKNGFKPMYSVSHNEKNWSLTYKNGWEDDGDYWYKKQNDWRFDYKPHHFTKHLPLTYSAYFEYGLWSNYDITSGNAGHKSWRREYAYYINHDPIKLFSPNTTLHLTYGRKWIYEGDTDDQVTTNMYYATLRQKVDSNKRLWISYLRENRKSSLFDIGQADMEKELRLGLQWKPDKNNVLSIVNRYNLGDVDNSKNHHSDITTRQYQTTYNWYHRFCCWALQLSYEHNWYKDDKTLKMQYFFYNW